MNSANATSLFFLNTDRDADVVLQSLLCLYDMRCRSFSTTSELLRAAGRHAPSLVIVNRSFSNGAGYEAIESMRDAGLDVPVAIVTEEETLKDAVAAQRSGVYTYVSLSPNGLRRLVRDVHALSVSISPMVSKKGAPESPTRYASVA